MTTTNENKDFEQMKSQFEAIKAKLDEQKLVSDRMIEKIIKDKVNFLNSLDIAGIIIMALFIPIITYMFPHEGHSWWMTSYTIFICVSAIVITLVDRKLSNNYSRNGSLEDYMNSIAKTKKRFIIGTYVSIIMVVGFFALYIYEKIVLLGRSPENMFGIYLGVVIGTVIGTWLTIKQWRALKTIQEQIDKMKRNS